MNAILGIILSCILAGDSEAAWMAADVGSMTEKAMCAVLGDLNGPVIVVCGENGPLYLYRWKSNHWTQERIDSGSDYPTSAAVGDLDGDGVNSIYLGSIIRNELLELSPLGASSWARKKHVLPGGMPSLSIGRSHHDGKPHLIVDSFTWREDVSPCIPGSSDKYALYDCYFDGGSLKFQFIGKSCGHPAIFNPKGTPKDRDIILGQEIWQRHQGKWSKLGGSGIVRNLAVSRDSPGRTFTDREERQYSAGFSSVLSTAGAGRELGTMYSYMNGPGILPIDGAYRALAPAKIRRDGLERLYSSDNERKVHEQTRTASGWSRSDTVGEFRGVADFLIVGDARADGKERLYVVHNGMGPDFRKSWIAEVDHVPTKPVVAALDVAILGTASAETAGILGDLLRAELAKSDHLVLTDRERIKDLMQERQFQRSQCGSPACLAGLGRVLKADVTVLTTLERKGESYSLECRMVDSSGRKGPGIRREKIDQRNILSAIRAAAFDLALLVPYATDRTGEE